MAEYSKKQGLKAGCASKVFFNRNAASEINYSTPDSWIPETLSRHLIERSHYVFLCHNRDLSCMYFSSASMIPPCFG